MTGADLIVLAPWIAFAAGLAVIGVLLLRSRRPSRRRPDPQETRCQPKNVKARPR